MKTSGWMNTDAVNWVKCPKCNQGIGKYCRTPKGKKCFEVHKERLQKLYKHPEFCLGNYIKGNMLWEDEFYM